MKNKIQTKRNYSITLTEEEKGLLRCGIEHAIYQNTLNIRDAERAAEIGQIDMSIQARTAILINTTKTRGGELTEEQKNAIREKVHKEFDI